MSKKRICFVFNHFQYQDGVCRSAIALANLLTERDDVNVDFLIIYKYDPSVLDLLSNKVKVNVICGFYFRGLDKLFKLIPRPILYNKYLKENYDVEIAFQSGTSYEIITSVLKQPKVLRIGWVHGYDDSNHMKLMYLAMDRLVCVSKINANRLFQHLEGKKQVDYCYNPINEDIVCKQGEDKISITRNRDVCQFVSVGRLSPEKGYKRLIKILARLKKNGYIFSFWLIGDGPDKESIEKLIKGNNLQDFVQLLGPQKNPHKYTVKADLFLCSSYSEGYSTVCAEAIILGIPVLTTPVSGAEEIISEANSGVITGMDDMSIYESLEYILKNRYLINDWKDIIKLTKEKFYSRERFKQFLRIIELR